MTRPNRRWSDLSPRARAGIILAATAQLILLGAAWTDLRRRSAAEVNGPRWLWALLSLVNFVGPLSYFAFGRRRR